MTVVVPTFRRQAGLGRVLQALAGQHDPGAPWSVLVVDNDEPPGCAEVFASATEHWTVGARRIVEPRRGASHARNRGVAEAGAEIVAFIDDDVEPEPDWLAALIEPIVAGRCDATGGRVVLDPDVPRPPWFREAFLGPHLAAFDLGDTECAVPDDGYVLTASAAFLKATLHRVGGFDPALGPRDGKQLVNDDVDLCRRAMASGASLHYVPSAVVHHELPAHRLRRRWLAQRLYWQGRSDWLIDRDVHSGRPVAESVRVALDLLFRWGALVRQGPWRRWVAYQMLWDGATAAGFLRDSIPVALRRRASPSSDGA